MSERDRLTQHANRELRQLFKQLDNDDDANEESSQPKEGKTTIYLARWKPLRSSLAANPIGCCADQTQLTSPDASRAFLRTKWPRWRHLAAENRTANQGKFQLVIFSCRINSEALFLHQPTNQPQYM